MKKSTRRTIRSVTSSPAGQVPPQVASWNERSYQLLLGAAVALTVAAPLMGSEGVLWQSTHAVLIMGWMLLIPACLGRCLLVPSQRWYFGPVEVALLLFLLLHSLSALVMLNAGHARLTLNALWLWWSFGGVFLTMRQLGRSGPSQRAICSVLLALASGLAVLGYYQVVYSNPKLRAEYARHPERMLRDEGQYLPDESPLRVQFENRLASSEPTGPFALTNSLAGFLTPCLVLLIGLAGPLRQSVSRRWQGVVAVGLLMLLMAGCLLLTKSRAAYVAIAAGVALLAWIKATSLSRRQWKWILATAGGLVLVVGLLFALGGLDRQVLTEAPKSLGYRLQYWRATVALIAEHPWFGCGPGNFKEFYTQYKLPEASEPVSDPHNFLLEVAATGGLPALLLFLLTGALAAWRLRTTLVASRISSGVVHERADDRDAPLAPRTWVPVYAGAAIGLALSVPAGWAVGWPSNFESLGVTLVVSAAVLWMLHPWVRQGTIPGGVLVIAAVALLVNLLAAGGLSFPGVAQLLWILLALALNRRDAERSDASLDALVGLPRAQRSLRGNLVLGSALAASLLLVLLCYLSMYRPVLAARERYARAFETATAPAFAEQCLAAASADPWWADPWELYAELVSQQWMRSPSVATLVEFDRAQNSMLQRCRHSSLLYRRSGDWLLGMYEASRQPDLLERAIRCHQEAVRLYPNSSILHAQLAADHFLAAQFDQAAAEAGEALRLDDLSPHSELKLKNQKLIESRLLESRGVDLGLPEGASAEHWMQAVRRLKDRE